MDEALALAQRAVDLGPTDWIALATSGEVLRQLGRYAEALDAFERAHELAEEADPRLLASVASTLNVLDRHEKHSRRSRKRWPSPRTTRSRSCCEPGSNGP